MSESLDVAGDSSAMTDQDFKRIEHDVQCVKDALALLGLRACCYCGKFFRSAEPGRLFDCGELVCLGCIQDWWTSRSPHAFVKQRELIERKLVNWLVTYHGGKIICKTQEFPDPDQQFRLTVSCSHCDGTGASLRKPCPFCAGRGTVCLALRKQTSAVPQKA